MIGTLDLATFTGCTLVMAGLFALGRQSLLEPASGRYPKAPTWLRHCMFGFATLVIFVGLQTIFSNNPVTNPMALLAVGLAVYNGAMLFNLLRQRYPEVVWNRLNKINDRLFCTQNSLRRFISE